MALNGIEMFSVKFPRIHPDFYQRADWHDYTSRCFYMITVNKSKDAPVFSAIRGELTPQGAVAHADLTPTGAIIERALQKVTEVFPFVEIGRTAIMPDHVHFMVFVKLAGVVRLGEIVRVFKKESSTAYRQRFEESLIALDGSSLFIDGFNDRIVYRRGQLERFKNYVLDNPRRHFLRVTYPQFFNRHESIEINGAIYNVYGNFMLLRHPDKEFVKVSSKYSAEELGQRQLAWEETIRGAGVLVSPFISPKEMEVMRDGIARGVSIIKVVNNGLPQRYKPAGECMDLCAEGRLLIIAPEKFRTRKEAIRRAECMALNEVAEYLAREDIGSLILKNGSRGN